MMLPLNYIYTLFLLNVAEPPSLHRAEIKSNDFVIYGNLYATLALNGSCGTFSIPECVAYIVLSLGSITTGLLEMGFWSIKGISIAR